MDGDTKPPDRTFTSWKEIAQFFQRDVSTVQRWEKEEGLPVHRHLHRRQSSVYASPEELEVWWRKRGLQLGPEPAEPRASRRRLWIGGGTTALIAVALVVAIGWNPKAAHSGLDLSARLRTISFQGTRPQGFLMPGPVGDLNGDGLGDIVFSASQASELYILFAARGTTAGGELPAAAQVVITGSPRTFLMASHIADFNGDGIDDLSVTELNEGQASYSDTAPSYLLFGRRQWPQTLDLPKSADVTIRLTETTDMRFASCLPLQGRSDLNQDGVADVVLSAYLWGPSDRASAGVLYVFFGRRQWPRALEASTAADVTILGSRMGEGLGGCSLGDFNGDGLIDLAAHASETPLWNLLGRRGKIYVFLGHRVWPRILDAKTDFQLRLDGDQPRALMPEVLLADVNGDKRDDLIAAGLVDSKGESSAPGEIRIWFGGENHKGILPTGTADVTILGGTAGAQLGQAFSAGDLDGDGIADLILAAPGQGELFLVRGRRQWEKRGRLEDYAPIRLFRGEIPARYARISWGDVDGDELPEIVFAAPEAPVGAAYQGGQAWVLKPFLPVRIDVRPGSEPNVILAKRGTSAIRMYGFSTAPEDQVDPASIRFAGTAPIRYVVQDYDGDGIADLQAYFDNEPLVLKPEVKRIAVTARTRSGLPVAGTDSIVVIPPPKEQPVRARERNDP